ncbi:MFS transporter [Kytococcus sp. Marseille-QA3725]
MPATAHFAEPPTEPDPVWRVPDVPWVIGGRGLVTASSRMLMVVLMLWVQSAGLGSYAMAAVMLAVALPALFFMGTAGEVADQYDSRRTLTVGVLVQTLGALGVAAAVAWSPRALVVPLVVVLAFVFQTGVTFNAPVWEALVPRIVGDGRVGAVASWQQGVTSIAGPLGAAVGGVIVGWISSTAALLLTAALAALVMVPSLLVATRRGGPGDELLRGAREEARRQAAESSAWSRFWRRTPFGQVSRSVAAVRSVPAAAAVVLVMFCFMIFQGASNVIEVFLVRGPLEATEAQYGMSEAFAAVGGVFGAWVTARIVAPSQRVWSLVAGLVIGGLALLGIAVAPHFWFYVAGQVALGVMQALVVASAITVVVTSTPDKRRGAVMAAFSGLLKLGTVCALSLGAVIGGVVDPRLAFLLLGAASLLAIVLTGWRLPGIARRMAQEEAAPAPARAAVAG